MREREGRAVIRSLLMLLRAPFVNVNDCDDGSGMKHFVATLESGLHVVYN